MTKYFISLIERWVKDDNRKDGVELITHPDHHFRCLKCGKTFTLHYDAERCCGKKQ